jgi:hypothetical protein
METDTRYSPPPFSRDIMLEKYGEKFESLTLKSGTILHIEKLSKPYHTNRYFFTDTLLGNISSYNTNNVWDITKEDEELLDLIVTTSEEIRKEAEEVDDDFGEFYRDIGYDDYSLSVEYFPFMDESITEELDSRE